MALAGGLIFGALRGAAIKVAVVAVLAGLAWSHWTAYRWGANEVEARVEREQAELRAARDKAENLAAQREAARLAAQEEADRLAMELEDAARADPGADAPALSADSVRRLSRR